MRLIDADVLIAMLGFENTQEERDENVGEIITLEDIDGIPTAYDTDKVVEQSCEWNLEDVESNLYVTGCENRELIFEGTPEENGYKYCPYCGRKIKRGGVNG